MRRSSRQPSKELWRLTPRVDHRQDMVDLIGPRPFDSPDAYDDAMGSSGRGPKGPPPSGGGDPSGQLLPRKQEDPHPLGRGIEGGEGVPMPQPALFREERTS